MKILQGGAKSTELPTGRNRYCACVGQTKEGRWKIVQMQSMWLWICTGRQFEDIQTHSGEKAYKCHQCNFASVQASKLRTLKLTLEKSTKMQRSDFASFQAHNLRRELKKAYKCNHLQLSIYSDRRFERTSENSIMWKIVKMRSMLLCICTGRQFEDTFGTSP